MPVLAQKFPSNSMSTKMKLDNYREPEISHQKTYHLIFNVIRPLTIWTNFLVNPLWVLLSHYMPMHYHRAGCDSITKYISYTNTVQSPAAMLQCYCRHISTAGILHHLNRLSGNMHSECSYVAMMFVSTRHENVDQEWGKGPREATHFDMGLALECRHFHENMFYLVHHRHCVQPWGQQA